MKLTNNDWLFLNDLIYKINSIKDTDQMRTLFLDLIRIIIPCDHLTFFLADHNSDNLMKSPIQIGFSDELTQSYLDEYEKLDYKYWIFASGKSVVYRLTDLYPPGVREKLPYYQKVHNKDNIHYEAILSLAYNNIFVGVVSLFRTKAECDFTDKEIYVLEIIKDHLAFRLYTDLSIDERVLCKDQAELQMDDFMEKYKLTKREIEVLRLITQGKQNKCICDKLYISSSTLKKHTINIYKKLGIRNRVELFKFITP